MATIAAPRSTKQAVAVISLAPFERYQSSVAIPLFAVATTPVSLATLPFLKDRAGTLDQQ